MFWIYFAFYFDLFTATFYWLKQNAFLKWNNSLFSFPLEALDKAGNKTFQWLCSPQSDDYREKKQWSVFHAALDGAFVGNHPPEPDRTKPLFRKSRPLTAVQIPLSQHCALALPQLWQVHDLKTLSAHPACDHAQLSLGQKARLGGLLLLTSWNTNSVQAAFGPLRTSSMKDLQHDLQSDAWLKVAQWAYLPGPSISKHAHIPGKKARTFWESR